MLKPETVETHPCFGGSKFKIDPERCSLCSHVCPEKAITSSQNQTRELHLSFVEEGAMAHARLGIAEENSGKLVSEARRHASRLATEAQASIIIADGPPGSSCPVIASITDADQALIVIGEIPLDRNIHDSLMAGKTIVEYNKGPAVETIKQIWCDIRQTLQADV